MADPGRSWGTLVPLPGLFAFASLNLGARTIPIVASVVLHAGIAAGLVVSAGGHPRAGTAPTVEMTTVTLGEVLERAKAPAFIHFLSLDIEGAELDALRGIPFDQYRFGAMAIEHNEEEPKRSDIIAFLQEHGYRRVHTYKQDDFFAPRN